MTCTCKQKVLFELSHGGSDPGSMLDSESRDVQPPTPDKLTSDKEADDDDDNINSNEEKQEAKGESDTEDGVLMRPAQAGHLGRAVAIDEAESEELGAGDSRCNSVDGTSKLSLVGDVDLKSEHKSEEDPKMTCATEQPNDIETEIDKCNGQNERDKKSTMPSKTHDEPRNPPQKVRFIANVLSIPVVFTEHLWLWNMLLTCKFI